MKTYFFPEIVLSGCIIYIYIPTDATNVGIFFTGCQTIQRRWNHHLALLIHHGCIDISLYLSKKKLGPIRRRKILLISRALSSTGSVLVTASLSAILFPLFLTELTSAEMLEKYATTPLKVIMFFLFRNLLSSLAIRRA